MLGQTQLLHLCWIVSSVEQPVGSSLDLLSAFKTPHGCSSKEAPVSDCLFFLQDLGLEGTFLNEVLYKNATFLNLVDPISHDLLMSLARDLQCPKKVNASLSSVNIL